MSHGFKAWDSSGVLMYDTNNFIVRTYGRYGFYAPKTANYVTTIGIPEIQLNGEWFVMGAGGFESKFERLFRIIAGGVTVKNANFETENFTYVEFVVYRR